MFRPSPNMDVELGPPTDVTVPPTTWSSTAIPSIAVPGSPPTAPPLGRIKQTGLSETAEFLAADSDMRSLVFRRFHLLSVRNLLFLEGRIAALEEHQRRLDEVQLPADAAHRVTLANRSWEEFAFLGTWGVEGSNFGIPDSALREWELKDKSRRSGAPDDDFLQEYYIVHGPSNNATIATNTKYVSEVTLVQAKWKTALALNEALKEYRHLRADTIAEEAALRYRDMMALAHPAKRTLDAIKELFQPKGAYAAPFNQGSAMSALFADPSDTQKFPRTVEAVSLYTPADEDPFTKLLIRWPWLTRRLRRKFFNERYAGFWHTSEKSIRKVVTFLTTVVALFFLVAAIFVLWLSKQTHVWVSLILLSTFVVLFAMWVSLGTNAKRSDVFAASAAYAAVLVVFISQT